MSNNPIEHLVQDLHARDIRIWVQDDRLRINAPKGGLPAELQQELSSRKDELLQFLLSIDKEGTNNTALPLTPTERGHDLPLSFGQQRIFLADALNPEENTAYTLTLNLRIKGVLNVDALTHSLSEIVRRHEVLRTVFQFKGDEPIQVIKTANDLILEHEDLCEIPENDRELKLHHLLEQAKYTQFDLALGPLFRTQLIKLNEHDHVLIITVHHIIFDGWSLTVLNRELKQLYDNFVEGQPPALPELPIQYGDFSSWQRAWLQGDSEKKLLDYWTRQLQDLPTLELVTDHARPAIQTFNGSVETLPLSHELTTALKSLSKKQGVTLYMTLLASLGVLLYRLTGQTDIVIGTPITNRDQEELQNLIGFFLNSLVIRLDLTGDPSFKELMTRVRRTMLDSFAHQHLPFERLLEEVVVERDSSRSPLFQVTFTMEGVPDSTIHLKNLKLSTMQVEEHTTRFDIEAYVSEHPTGLVLNLTYNTDLFEGVTIRRMLAQHHNLLASIVENSQLPLSQLQMLSKNERKQILLEWNATNTDYPRDETVHALFEAQADKVADAVAVDYDGQSLSYGELNERANRLAHYLRAKGVGPDVMVGICIERSQEMVVGLLGILKAGGAYVPLDPDYPKPRLTFMLEDAQVPVLLTLSSLKTNLPEFDGTVVYLDTDWPDIEQASADDPASSASADNLAYVIYTSGSTGQPKGVAVPHRAINRLVSNTDYFQVGPADRVAQASNVSFDAATFELWGALLNGATLVGVNKDVLLNPQSLSSFLNAQGITALFITTALFNLIAREAPTAFNSLRGVMFGGEAVDPKAVSTILTSGPPERLLHVYGPTESTTFASWYKVEEVAEDATTVPIGRPIANTRLYILDSDMNPVPVGVPGELYIGGDGLARGYLGHPKLTAQRFVADPFSNEMGARLYRTGDRVRFRTDGAIEFLGRFDHQVKVRGFRIELGELEAVLADHPDVSQAVVIVNDDVDKGQRLFAYTIPASESSPAAEDIREYLRQRLPEYMIPASVIWLDEFPLTPNGKIDYRALPAPAHLQKRTSISNKPETEMEITMARIWQQVLDIDDIEANDMFFDLGGHSLLSVKVVEKFAEETGVHLSPLNLLNQTLRQLVAGLESAAEVSRKNPTKGFFDVLKKNILKRG